ncbi:hypothetical protein [Corynebacterium sp. 21KM1197]|nr:hypothetical protein [Corynebacterium sp. 21KM1197]WPF69825.1 hypothetical protein OLW90_11555 [Corynebacterium sp. 21KM1197]
MGIAKLVIGILSISAMLAVSFAIISLLVVLIKRTADKDSH